MSKIKLLHHQVQFIDDTTTPFLGLCAGYRSGKTFCLAYKAIRMAIINAPLEGALLAPTMTMVRRLLVPEMIKALNSVGIKYKLRKSDPVHFILHLPQGDTIIHLLSAENYDRAVGMTLSWFGVDEADRMNCDVATDSFRTLTSRLTNGKAVQAFAVSTPEGYNWMYNFFDSPDIDESDRKKRRLIRASTYNNPYVRKEYFDDMRSTYPAKQLKAYLNGEFVNLTEGNVYYCFERDFNNCDYTITSFDHDGNKAPLHIGMDFNVGKSTAIVHLMINDIPYAVDEITGEQNTQSMIDEIRRRYGFDRKIYVYPDASGNSQHTNASQTDLAALHRAGFNVRNPNKNPFVRDRVASMNARFRNAKGQRMYFVNVSTCPTYTKCLEQQGYKHGEPDKSGDLDHSVDAAGYFIHYHYAANRLQLVQRGRLAG